MPFCRPVLIALLSATILSCAALFNRSSNPALIPSSRSALADYTHIDIHQYGIPPVFIHPEPGTHFIIGGTNPTALIRELTHLNGIAIHRLEEKLRPGQGSPEGFLGEHEGLLDVLASDNDYVTGLGLTHVELAKHLHAMGVISRQQTGSYGEFLYSGRRYLIIRADTHGGQESPFEDGMKSDLNIVVANLDNGAKISFSLLLPFIIERYGFYEGKGSPYRLEPSKVVETFDFLRRAAPRHRQPLSKQSSLHRLSAGG